MKKILCSNPLCAARTTHAQKSGLKNEHQQVSVSEEFDETVDTAYCSNTCKAMHSKGATIASGEPQYVIRRADKFSGVSEIMHNHPPQSKLNATAAVQDMVMQDTLRRVEGVVYTLERWPQ